MVKHWLPPVSAGEILSGGNTRLDDGILAIAEASFQGQVSPFLTLLRCPDGNGGNGEMEKAVNAM